MSLKCLLGHHDWSQDCKKCSKCGKLRNVEHDWSDNCEKCSNCNVVRTDEHDWSVDCEKCSKCNLERADAHDWSNDCRKCNNCGKIRNVEHDWSQDCEKCSKCGLERKDAHDWSRDCEKCSTCGKTRERAHVWDESKCTVCGSQNRLIASVPRYLITPSLAVSGDCLKIAYAARCPSGFNSPQDVFLNGEKISQYHGIQMGYPVFSPDSKRMGFVAMLSNSKRILVVDNHKTQEYDKIAGFVFSGDSSVFAYAAQSKKEGLKQASDFKECVVIQDKHGKWFDGIVDFPVLNHDGTKCVYAACEGDKNFFMLNDKIIEENNGAVLSTSMAYSFERQRLAYAVEVDGTQYVIDNGQEGKRYSLICKNDPTLSPDGKRIAYGAAIDGKCLYVIDGIESEKYDQIGPLFFSPDSHSCAYSAMIGNEWFVVLDGVRQKMYSGMKIGSYSPDSKRFAYIVSHDNKQAVIAGNECYGWFDRIEGLPSFSPDGNHLAFFARKGKEGVIVIDGKIRQIPYIRLLSDIYFESSSRIRYMAFSGPGLECRNYLSNGRIETFSQGNVYLAGMDL